MKGLLPRSAREFCTLGGKNWQNWSGEGDGFARYVDERVAAAYAHTLKPQWASDLRYLESSAPMPVATVALTRNSGPLDSSDPWMNNRGHVKIHEMAHPCPCLDCRTH